MAVPASRGVRRLPADIRDRQLSSGNREPRRLVRNERSSEIANLTRLQASAVRWKVLRVATRSLAPVEQWLKLRIAGSRSLKFRPATTRLFPLRARFPSTQRQNRNDLVGQAISRCVILSKLGESELGLGRMFTIWPPPACGARTMASMALPDSLAKQRDCRQKVHVLSGCHLRTKKHIYVYEAAREEFISLPFACVLTQRAMCCSTPVVPQMSLRTLKGLGERWCGR